MMPSVLHYDRLWQVFWKMRLNLVFFFYFLFQCLKIISLHSLLRLNHFKVVFHLQRFHGIITESSFSHNRHIGIISLANEVMNPNF